MQIKLFLVFVVISLGGFLSSVSASPMLAKMIESNLPFVVSASSGTFEPFQFDTEALVLAGHTRCVVGADDLSLYWLAQRKEVLLKYHVVCYLANVQSLVEIDRVRQAAHPVPVVLASAEALVSLFGVTRYPAIIHSGWVFQ